MQRSQKTMVTSIKEKRLQPDKVQEATKCKHEHEQLMKCDQENMSVLQPSTSAKLPSLWQETHRMWEEQALQEALQEPHQKSASRETQGRAQQREQYMTHNKTVTHQTKSLKQ